MLQTQILKNFRFNFTVNVADATFFGFGMGFASFVSIIPLFVSTLTDSSAVIGFISSMHIVGWYLPQLFTADRVARMRRLKPFVLLMTINERWPFFGLALVALFAPSMDKNLAFALMLLFVMIHALGGGFTSTAWQTMISRIMPGHRLGVFYGVQSGAANLLGAAGAAMAGMILLLVDSPYDFAICFAITGVFMTISWFFLRATREPEEVIAAVEIPPERNDAAHRGIFWTRIRQILQRDPNFRWFLAARVLAQFSWMASNFYTIYAVRNMGMDEGTAGLMTSVLLISQTVASPVLGWLGDSSGHRRVFVAGISMMSLGALLALVAPGLGWFYLVFALTGFANAVLWTTTMSIIVEFGTANERPYYIGLTNTLIGPAALIAPLLGGWLVDSVSFGSMFLVSGAAGFIAMLLMLVMVEDPRRIKARMPVATMPIAVE